MADRINERFQLERAIEESPEGVWYRGTDEKTQKAVLIATLTPAADEWTREGFEKFQELGRRVSHPAIARFVESGRTADDSAYLVIDLPSGPTLADRLLITPPLTAHELVRMSISLLDGLQAAHRQGIVHGDIEPGAILVTGEGRATLTRFGLNRAAAIARRIPSFDGVKLARSKRMAAPEILAGEQPTVASDLYSIGAILYEALAGKGHRAEPSPDAEPLGLREVRPQVPGALAEVVDRLLSNDPSARPDSASTVRRELTQAMMKAPTIAKLKVATAIEEPTPEPTQQLNIDDLEQEMGYGPIGEESATPPATAPEADGALQAGSERTTVEIADDAASLARRDAGDSDDAREAAPAQAPARAESGADGGPAKKRAALIAIAILVLIVLGLVFAMSGGDDEVPPVAPELQDEKVGETIEPSRAAEETKAGAAGASNEASEGDKAGTPDAEAAQKAEAAEDASEVTEANKAEAPKPEEPKVEAPPAKNTSTMRSSTAMSATSMSTTSTNSTSMTSTSMSSSGGLKTNPGF